MKKIKETDPSKMDKRTKEYKAWKAEFEHKQASKPDGLGDVIENITEATGIKKVVKWLAGEDCGCDERREKLNKMHPFSKPKCFTEDEYNWLKEFIPRKKIQVIREDRDRMYEIYNRVFGTNLKTTNCGSCNKNVITKLTSIFKTYE